MPPDGLMVARGGAAARRGGAAGLDVRLTLAARPAEVRAALADLLAAAAEAGTDAPLARTFELVLAEVLNNVVEHAFAGRPPGRIEVSVVERGGGVDCLVRDGGRPMPGLRVPPGHRPPTDVPAPCLPEGGFGWFLIATLARDIGYAHAQGVNELRFRVARDEAAP